MKQFDISKFSKGFDVPVTEIHNLVKLIKKTQKELEKEYKKFKDIKIEIKN